MEIPNTKSVFELVPLETSSNDFNNNNNNNNNSSIMKTVEIPTRRIASIFEPCVDPRLGRNHQKVEATESTNELPPFGYFFPLLSKLEEKKQQLEAELRKFNQEKQVLIAQKEYLDILQQELAHENQQILEKEKYLADLNAMAYEAGYKAAVRLSESLMKLQESREQNEEEYQKRYAVHEAEKLAGRMTKTLLKSKKKHWGLAEYISISSTSTDTSSTTINTAATVDTALCNDREIVVARNEEEPVAIPEATLEEAAKVVQNERTRTSHVNDSNRCSLPSLSAEPAISKPPAKRRRVLQDLTNLQAPPYYSPQPSTSAASSSFDPATQKRTTLLIETPTVNPEKKRKNNKSKKSENETPTMFKPKKEPAKKSSFEKWRTTGIPPKNLFTSVCATTSSVKRPIESPTIAVASPPPPPSAASLPSTSTSLPSTAAEKTENSMEIDDFLSIPLPTLASPPEFPDFIEEFINDVMQYKQQPQLSEESSDSEDDVAIEKRRDE